LSWSPIEPDAAAQPAAPARVTPAVRQEQVTAVSAAGGAEDGGTNRMAANVSDDRISPLLKFALSTVVFIVLTSLIVGAALWMAIFSKPPEVKFPELVGMKIEDARAAAGKAGVRLLEHEEFNEKAEPSVIYRTDLVQGRPMRPGRVINIW